MHERNGKGRIIGQPIIEMEANKEVIDTHIYFNKERFQIRRKKRKTIYESKMFSVRTSKKYCLRGVLQEIYKIFASGRGAQMQRKKICFYCNEKKITGDEGKCNEYR